MKDARQRLGVHYETLIKSIARSRIAAEETFRRNCPQDIGQKLRSKAGR